MEASEREPTARRAVLSRPAASSMGPATRAYCAKGLEDPGPCSHTHALGGLGSCLRAPFARFGLFLALTGRPPVPEVSCVLCEPPAHGSRWLPCEPTAHAPPNSCVCFQWRGRKGV